MKSVTSWLNRHRRLSMLRDPMFRENRTAKGFARVGSAFFFLYMCFSGYYFGTMARMISPELPSYVVFNGMLLYMLLGSLLLRLMTPFNPVAPLLHYSHLPVSRKLLVRWSVAWSFFSKEMLLWTLFVLSYILFEMRKSFSWMECLAFFVAFLFLLLIRHFGLMWVRLELRSPSKTVLSLLWVLGAAVVMAAALLPLTEISRTLGLWMIGSEPLLWGVLLPVSGLLFFLYMATLARHLYRELEMSGTEKSSKLRRLKMDDRLTGVGTMIWFEFVKWVRIKRGWLTLLTPLLFVVMLVYLYGPLQEGTGKPSVQYFFVILGMAAPGQSLRQFLFSIDSFHFDGLMTRYGAVRNLLFAKYYVDVLLTCAGALLMTPLLFLDYISWAQWIGYLLYTVGIYNLFGYIPAIYGRARMDYVGGKQAHGINGAQWAWGTGITILGLLLLFLPPLLMPEPWKTAYPCLAGLLGLLLHRPFLQWVYRSFYKQRYKALSGFRGA